MRDEPGILDPASTDRHTERKSQSQPPQQLAPEQYEAWRVWLLDRLFTLNYATRAHDGKPRIYTTELEREIRRLLPDAPVPLDTLRNVVVRGKLPEHAAARGLSAALGVSEIAILLRSGKLDWDAVAPLLGPQPAYLRTKEEYEREIAELEWQIPDAQFRARMRRMIDADWQLAQHLDEQRRWLGIDDDEWEMLRQEINDPKAREALRSELASSPSPTTTTTDDAPPLTTLPREFVASGIDDDENM